MIIDWDRFEDCLSIARVLTGIGKINDIDYEKAIARKEERYPTLDVKQILKFSNLFHKSEHVQEESLVEATERYFPFLVYRELEGIQRVAWSTIVAESNDRMENRLQSDAKMTEAQGFDPTRHIRCWLKFPNEINPIPVFAKWGREEALNIAPPNHVREQLTGQVVGSVLHVNYMQRAFLIGSIEIYTKHGKLRPYGSMIKEDDEIDEIWLIEAKYFDLES